MHLLVHLDFSQANAHLIYFVPRLIEPQISCIGYTETERLAQTGVLITTMRPCGGTHTPVHYSCGSFAPLSPILIQGKSFCGPQ